MNNFEKIKQLYNLTDNRKKFGYEENELNELEISLKITLPKKLKEYYLNLGKYENINAIHNRLLKPNKEVGFSEDRFLMFYEENQAVVSWGIKETDLKLENPPIWGNYGTNDLPDWYLESKTIEDFFLLMAVFNGTLGGLKYNGNSFELINPEIVDKIKSNWKEIPEISTEKQKVFTDKFNEIISLSFDQNQNCTGILIGTSHKDRFDNILNNLNIKWSYISYEDDE